MMTRLAGIGRKHFKMHHRAALWAVFGAAFFGSGAFNFLAAQSIDLGRIEGEGSGALVRTLFVEADDADFLKLLQQLFSRHGGFSKVPESRADFTFRFESGRGTSQQVRLIISSGQPRRVLYETLVTGSDAKAALLRAADQAVQRTLGIPGFFGGQLAFMSDRSGHAEVYLTDFSFANLSRLTSDKSNALGPQLSPDGRILLYTSYFRSGFPDVHRIDLGSGQRSLFAGFKGMNMGARWNPSGDSVALILSGTGNAELYLSDPVGRNLRRLTRSRGTESDPTWSPDGQRLAFTSDEAGRPQIYQMQVDGTGMRRVPTNISGYCAEPDWNPRHANLLAFTIAQGRNFQIALFDFTTGRSEVLSQGRADSMQPVWMPDGRHLMFTLQTGAQQSLHLMDTHSKRVFPLISASWGNTAEASFVYPR
jgi:TolB protein